MEPENLLSMINFKKLIVFAKLNKNIDFPYNLFLLAIEKESLIFKRRSIYAL